jgi:hypothetical protein
MPEHAAEEVALGGGMPVSVVVTAAPVVGLGAGCGGYGGEGPDTWRADPEVSPRRSLCRHGWAAGASQVPCGSV